MNCNTSTSIAEVLIGMSVGITFAVLFLLVIHRVALMSIRGK